MSSTSCQGASPQVPLFSLDSFRYCSGSLTDSSGSLDRLGLWVVIYRLVFPSFRIWNAWIFKLRLQKQCSGQANITFGSSSVNPNCGSASYMDIFVAMRKISFFTHRYLLILRSFIFGLMYGLFELFSECSFVLRLNIKDQKTS